MSEETKTPAVLAALMGVMDDVRSIDKAGSMSIAGSSYRFRRADDVMNAIGEAFRDHGVMLQSQVLHSEHEHYETTKTATFKGKEELKTTHWTQTYLTIRYTFTSLVDGSGVSAEGIGEGLDSGDKSSSKAMTGALKYALTQALQIAFKDMADPDNERPETQGDEPETEAQRLLRERRQEQAKANPLEPKSSAPAEQAKLSDDSVTAAAAKAAAEQVNQAEAARMAAQEQMKADAEQGAPDPMEAATEALKTELGARVMDGPGERERQAEEALSHASRKLAEMRASGSDWPALSQQDTDNMTRALAEARKLDTTRDKVNRIVLHADKLGLLTKLHGDNSFGAQIHAVRGTIPVPA